MSDEIDIHDDPYLHLHMENYHDAYNNPELKHSGLFFTRNRPRQTLDGEWGCTLDRYDEGLRQKWVHNPPGAAKEWILPPDYSHEGGKRVVLPACVNLLDEKWDFYEGPMWFTKSFDFRPNNRERVFLHVGAAANQARVFLNGVFLGMHLGASTPFCVELPNLREKDNCLQIQIDNTRRPEHVPMNHIDWYNYGGVYRSVSLFSLPKVFIADFRAALLPNGQMNKIRFSLTLSDAIDGEASVAIPELKIQLQIPIKNGIGEAVVSAQPELWSPESPRLYAIVADFGADRVSDRVGFRDIRVDGEHILLNGKRLWLRGVSVHEEYPGLGKAANEGVIREMLTHARELGCNFMRLAHYPHHEAVAVLADELGIMLWEEIPVYWAIAFNRQATLNDAENQLRELIKRDFNRASVIVWGVGNENADTDARYNFMSHLAAVARAADGTRLVSAACLINREKFIIEDRLSAHLDIIGINEYFGWYEPSFDNLSRLLNTSNPGKPVIITETGADAVVGHHGGERELFTEECQAEVYRQQIERLRACSFIQGMTPWILYDFRTERRQNHFQKGHNLKGLIAGDHKSKKEAFSVLADFYCAKAEER